MYTIVHSRFLGCSGALESGRCPTAPSPLALECLALADDDRDIDLYHWFSSKFSAAWRDTLSVLAARGRAQVSVAAATADWPKHIRDMRYADQDDHGTAD